MVGQDLPRSRLVSAQVVCGEPLLLLLSVKEDVLPLGLGELEAGDPGKQLGQCFRVELTQGGLNCGLWLGWLGLGLGLRLLLAESGLLFCIFALLVELVSEWLRLSLDVSVNLDARLVRDVRHVKLEIASAVPVAVPSLLHNSGNASLLDGGQLGAPLLNEQGFL